MDFVEILNVSLDLSLFIFLFQWMLSFFRVKLLLCTRMLQLFSWSQVEYKIVQLTSPFSVFPKPFLDTSYLPNQSLPSPVFPKWYSPEVLQQLPCHLCCQSYFCLVLTSAASHSSVSIETQ